MSIKEKTWVQTQEERKEKNSRRKKKEQTLAYPGTFHVHTESSFAITSVASVRLILLQ